MSNGHHPLHRLACTSFCLLFALVNGTTPAFPAATTANPSVLPPALPARETNPWAKSPAGATASARTGKQLIKGFGLRVKIQYNSYKISLM